MWIAAKIRTWLYASRETELLSSISALTQRSNDLSEEVRSLREELRSISAERDRAAASERQTIQKLADMLSYRTLGRAIFDPQAFERKLDEETEKKLAEWKKSSPSRGTAIQRKMEQDFLRDHQLFGVEPVFSKDDETTEGVN